MAEGSRDGEFIKPGKIIELDKKHIFRQPFRPFIIDSAKGSIISDAYGKKYIDLVGGLYGAVAVGWQRKEVISAMAAQMKKLSFAPEKTPSEACSRLAEELSGILDCKLTKFLRAVSGSEAADLAIKAARSYTGKKTIISTLNAYHGQTYGGVSFESDKRYDAKYGPLVPKILKIPFPYEYRGVTAEQSLGAIKKAMREKNDVGAIIMEPVQGSGAISSSREYFKELREVCDGKGVLLIFDEVITGFGRLGSKFAYQHYGIVPDIVILGKAISSGYAPIATTAMDEDIASKFDAYGNISTFGWNPICAAAASANLGVIIKERLWLEAKRNGKYFLARARERLNHDIVGEIRGTGLFIGIELVKDNASMTPDPDLARSALRRCIENGVYISKGGPLNNTLIITPPLVIDKRQIDRSIEIIGRSIIQASSKGLSKNNINW